MVNRSIRLTERLTPDQWQRYLKIENWARRLDEAFVIPGLKIKIGWDALIGLIPVAGDTITSILSLMLIWRAAKLGVPRATLLKMGFNILIDWAGGSIPVIGDIFDVVYCANSRNLALLEEYFSVQEPLTIDMVEAVTDSGEDRIQS